MKKYLKWFGVALVFYAIFYIGMAILKEQYAPTRAYLTEENKDRSVIYTINDVELNIPLVYLDEPLNRVRSGERDGALLITTIDDMQPLKVPSQNFFNRNEQNQLLRIYIQKQKRTPNSKSFQEWAYGDRESVLGQSYAGKEFGLEKYNDGEAGSSRKDLYYYPSDKNIETHIRCSKPDRPYPRCSIYFEDGKLRYSLSFDRKHNIQNWKQIKSSSIHLINSFKRQSGE